MNQNAKEDIHRGLGVKPWIRELCAGHQQHMTQANAVRTLTILTSKTNDSVLLCLHASMFDWRHADHRLVYIIQSVLGQAWQLGILDDPREVLLDRLDPFAMATTPLDTSVIPLLKA